jgi:CRP-like cAMP-binding protein
MDFVTPDPRVGRGTGDRVASAQQMEQHAEWIGQCLGRPELAPLDSDDLAELAALLREEHYPAGKTIFQSGDAPTRVGVVRSGAIALSRDLNGRRVVLHVLRPGDALGDIGVILRMTAPYDGVALEDSLVLTVDAVEFHRLLQQRPRVALRWLNCVSCRLISYQARLTEVLAGDIEAQIASVLIRRAVRGVVNLNQAHLAELIGGSRSSVNRVLRQLEEQNLVRLRYGQVEILDETMLGLVAGHGQVPAPPERADTAT